MSNCTVSLEFNDQAYLPADANVEILPRQSQIRCGNITHANTDHRSNVEMLDFDLKSFANTGSASAQSYCYLYCLPPLFFYSFFVQSWHEKLKIIWSI